MSDAPLGTAPGSAGEMQAADISAKVDADTGPAEAKVRSLGQRLVGVAQSSTRALSGIGRSLGGDNFLAPLAGMIQSVSPGLDLIASRGDKAEGALAKIGRTSAGIAGVGMAVAGLGAALQSMAAPLQRANAALTTAISNTNTAAGTGAQAVEAYKGKMDAAERSGAKYGYTMSDVGGALAKLTVQTKDPAEALKELNFAETLAAASGVSVSRAAEMIGRMHAGQFRYLRQFGIYIQNINTQHLSVAEATKRHADALQRLQDAQQRLNDFEARTTEARQKREEAWAGKVQAAQQKAGDARQHYEELSQRLTDQETYEAQKYAEDVAAANEKVADSERSLAELKARLFAEDQDRMEQRAEDIENAQSAYADASDNVRSLVREQAASPATTGPEQIRQQEAMKNATDAQAKAAERLNDIQLKSLQTHEQQVSRTQEMEHAENAVADAARNKNQVEERHVIVQNQILAQQQEVTRAFEESNRAAATLADIEEKARVAGLPTLAEKQQEARLREGVSKATQGEKDAQDKLNEAKNVEAAINARFEEGMTQFMAREKGLLEARKKTWAGHFAALKAQIVNFFQKDLGDIGGTLFAAGSGIAGIGMIFNIGSKVTGFLKELGRAKQGATIATEIGESVAGIGAGAEAAEAGTAVAAPGIIASLGGIIVAAAPILAVVAAIALVAVAGYEIVTHWKEISKDLAAGWGKIESFVKGVFNGIVDFFKKWGITILELIVPGPGWIAFIVQHWGAISGVISSVGESILDWFVHLPGRLLGLLKDAGDWLLNAGHSIVNGMVNGLFGAIEGVWHWFTSFLPDGIRQRVQGAGDWLIDMGRRLLLGIVNGIFAVEHFLWDFWTGLPGRIWRAIGDAGRWLLETGENILKGLWNGLVGWWHNIEHWFQDKINWIKHIPIIGGLLGSPSPVYRQYGRWLVEGLVQGLDQEHPSLVKKMDDIWGTTKDFRPPPPMGPAATGGSMFGPMGRPGTGGVPGAGPGGAPPTVVNMTFEIAGTVIGQRELFDAFRDFLLKQGSRQGGNYLGAGSNTV